MTMEMQKAEELITCFGEKYGYVPVFGDSNLAEVFDDIELVDFFEHGIRLWIAKPLSGLHQSAGIDPDFGFAIIMVINAIPEFLGKIQGHPENKQYEKGIEYILGKGIDGEIKGCLRLNLRNSIAHNLFTQENIILNLRGHTPVQYNRDGTAIIISPIALSNAFLNAIHKYIEELRAELDPKQNTDTSLFSSFKKYMINGKIKYFAVEYQAVSYGYRKRIKPDTRIERKIKNMGKFQVFDDTPDTPDIVVQTPGQLLQLCKQLVQPLQQK